MKILLINTELLARVTRSIQKKFPVYMRNILKASADHGVFGMPLLDAVFRQFPATSCENCGICCNGISIYSLEYHYMIRDVMGRLSPVQMQDMFGRILSLSDRLVEAAGEKRVRCPFRDDQVRVCLVHPVRPCACRMFGMKKEDGTRDCGQVREVDARPRTSLVEFEALQQKIMENSESWEVFPDRPAVSFFPIDFWVFRYSLGPEKALEIYRDILVPSSTPLTKFWQEVTVPN